MNRPTVPEPRAVLPFPGTAAPKARRPRGARAGAKREAAPVVSLPPPPSALAPGAICTAVDTADEAKRILVHYFSVDDSRRRVLAEVARELVDAYGRRFVEPGDLVDALLVWQDIGRSLPPTWLPEAISLGRVLLACDDEARTDVLMYARCRLRRCGVRS